MIQLKAKILENKKISQNFYKMRIESSYLAKNSEPGQFVEVRCTEKTDPLLRRPLSVHRVVKGGIELLYEVVGRGTELLSLMKHGGSLDVIGPLGHGFIIDERTKGRKNERTIIVAGGNGVAPLLFLAEELAKKNSEMNILIGGCSKSHILCEKEFKKTGAKVLVATEDGSKGHKGLVTHLLKELLAAGGLQHAIIYACGPVGMLKAVSNIAGERHVPCQVSLEEKMACGVGACLGCPVKIRRGHGLMGEGYEFKMVCKDGPVFNAEEVVWE